VKTTEPIRRCNLQFIDLADQQKCIRSQIEKNILAVLDHGQYIIGPGVFVHETAIVDQGATIGPGAKIWHFSHVLSGSTIGEHCNIGQNVVIGPDVSVGEGCKIQNNASVYKDVTLEAGVFCGPSMVFTGTGFITSPLGGR
jgi:UDP-3-O-[3-hydroxymyristoyl] glucosamine N-acyltransferase